MGQIIKWKRNNMVMISNDGDLCDIELIVRDYTSFYYISVYVNGRMKCGYDIKDIDELKESVRDKVKEF